MLDKPQKFFCELPTVCVTPKVFCCETCALYGIFTAVRVQYHMRLKMQHSVVTKVSITDKPDLLFSKINSMFIFRCRTLSVKVIFITCVIFCWVTLTCTICVIVIYSKQRGCEKRCGPVHNGQWEKSCEIKRGSQEMAVMVYIHCRLMTIILITTIQVYLCFLILTSPVINTNSQIHKFLPSNSHSLVAPFDFTTFPLTSTAPFLQPGC